MALQDIEPITKPPINDLDADAELEAGLIKLAPFLRAFAISPLMFETPSAKRLVAPHVEARCCEYYHFLKPTPTSPV